MKLEDLITQIDTALSRSTDIEQAKLTRDISKKLRELQDYKNLCQITGWTKIEEWKRDADQDLDTKCYIVYNGRVINAWYNPLKDCFYRKRYANDKNPILYVQEYIRWVRHI